MNKSIIKPRFKSFIILFLLFGFPFYSYADKRVALIIGNSNYMDGGDYWPLTQPVNDAEAMGKALYSLGFDTLLLKNGNRDEMLKKLDEFTNRLEKADVAVFYYSGHGNLINHTHYLVPAKSQINSSALEEHLLKLDSFERIMSKHSKQSFIFYDACRNEPSFDGDENDNHSTKGGKSFREKFMAARGNVVTKCFATTAGEAAYSGNGTTLSPFTEVLLDKIHKQKNFIDIWNDDIRTDSRLQNQIPEMVNPCSGSFYFNRPLQLEQPRQSATGLNNMPNLNNHDSILKNVDYLISQLDFQGAINLLNQIPDSYHNHNAIRKQISELTFYLTEQKAGRIVSPKLAEVVSSYDEVYRSFHNGWAIVGKYVNGEKWYNFISPKGEEMFPQGSPYWYHDFSDGMAYDYDEEGPIKLSNIVDSLGNYTRVSGHARYKCYSTSAFKEGLLLIRDNESEKFGYLDKNGDVVIKCIYDEANFFSNGRALVKKGKKWHFIDKKGKIVIKNIRPSIYTRFSENYAWIRFADKEIYEYRLINTYNTDWCCSVPGYFSIKNIDVIVDCISPMYNGLSLVDAHYINGQNRINFYFFVYANGTFLNDFEMFDFAFDFREGKAVVMKDRKFAVIDTNGKTVIPYGKFTYIESFSEGLATARSHDMKVGFINDDGETIIPFEFDHGDSFSDGFALVCKNGKWGYVDKYGFTTLTVDITK